MPIAARGCLASFLLSWALFLDNHNCPQGGGLFSSLGMRAVAAFLKQQHHQRLGTFRRPRATTTLLRVPTRTRITSGAGGGSSVLCFASAAAAASPDPPIRSSSSPPPRHPALTNPDIMSSSADGDNDDDTHSTQQQQHSAYEKWVRRLYQTNLFHPVKMGLDNIEKLYAALGQPLDHNIAVVHIAGTNGKGSVALKIANTLQLAGQDQGQKNWRVGLFCSPHVSSFRERMQVNGQLISEEEVVELLPRIYQLCREHDIPATFFEITTALAFMFFAASHCQVVVLETGLGGRLDATNVVPQPALAVITSIGLEHTRILGDTIELIAREKGGIIKPDRPVLVGPHVPHDVLRACAAEKGASRYYTVNDVLTSSSSSSDASDGEPQQLLQDDEEEDYDVENTHIATAALQLLQESHPQLLKQPISKHILQQGTSIRPPCRFEEVKLDKYGLTVILDVAHNPPAMDYLVRKLQATYNNNPTTDDTTPKQQQQQQQQQQRRRASFRMVVGMSSDKDLNLCCQSVLRAVDGDASRIHLVQALHPRAAKLEAILEASPACTNNNDDDKQATTNLLRSAAHYDLADPSITKQIALAIQLATKNKNEILVVCGSVFLMAEAREALGCFPDEPRDSAYIAEVAGAGVRHGQENFGNRSTTPSPPPPPPSPTTAAAAVADK